MKLSNPYKKFIKFVVVIVVIGAIYFAGYLVGHKNLILEKGYVPKISNLDLGKQKDVDFSLFWQAWNIVKDKYIGKTDSQKMVYGAIAGMVNAVGDPYTLFMNPDDVKIFMDNLNGSFNGIGVEIDQSDGHLVIVSPIEGMPAEKAGLKSKDIIVKIDGQEVSELTYYGAINKIRGEKGTEVNLTIFREGWDNTKDFIIKRDTITVKSVKWEIKGDDTYIQISQFGDDTTDLVKDALAFSEKNNAQGIIVDLRNNPGGYFQDAVDIASLFLEQGKVVVKEEDKYGNKKEFKTTLKQISTKKLVVLVNSGSASSSEIFSGAIQDNKRGILIGEKTFGKGSVQALQDLSDGSRMRVTIAKWLTPDNKNISKEGITPDVEVKLSDEDIKNKKDVQLDKALEEIRK